MMAKNSRLCLRKNDACKPFRQNKLGKGIKGLQSQIPLLVLLSDADGREGVRS